MGCRPHGDGSIIQAGQTVRALSTCTLIQATTLRGHGRLQMSLQDGAIVTSRWRSQTEPSRPQSAVMEKMNYFHINADGNWDIVDIETPQVAIM